MKTEKKQKEKGYPISTLLDNLFRIIFLFWNRSSRQKLKFNLLNQLDDRHLCGVASAGAGFDYAAVMTAMLRSQGVPTKLIVGYTGNAYHAWINVYSKKKGRISKMIYFNGKKWKLMDPTFASTSKSSKSIMKYIGNGRNYKEKLSY